MRHLILVTLLSMSFVISQQSDKNKSQKKIDELEKEVDELKRDVARSTFIPKAQWGNSFSWDIGVGHYVSRTYTSIGFYTPRWKNRYYVGIRTHFQMQFENNATKQEFLIRPALSALFGFSSPVMFSVTRVYAVSEFFFSHSDLELRFQKNNRWRRISYRDLDPNVEKINQRYILNLLGGVEFYFSPKITFYIEGGLPLQLQFEKQVSKGETDYQRNFDMGFTAKVGFRFYVDLNRD